MNTPGVHLLSLGLATPEHSITQSAAAKFAVGRSGVQNGAAAFIERIHRNSGVTTRGSVLLAPTVERPAAIPFFDSSETSGGPTTAQRLARFEAEAGPLAESAATIALQRAGVPVHRITDLVTVSCTGLAAPGIDCELIRRMGLPPCVRRTNIGFMGCFGGIVGLRTGAAFAAARSDAVVLIVCVELCSLHFQDRAPPDQAVANALFADGAAAAVLAAGDNHPGPVIASAASVVLPDTAELMSWRVGDHGFEMRLDASVPARLAAQLAPWLNSWLAASGLKPEDITSWAVHPGGPRILTEVASALRLPARACEPSASVLAHHGNMSSATVLFVLDRILSEPADPPLPCVALAFGPGLSCEGLLLTGDTNRQQSRVNPEPAP